MGSQASGSRLQLAGRRPLGVTLAAIVLALMSAWGLLTAFGIMVTALTVHTPQMAQFPAIRTTQIAMGVLTLLVSAFAGFTVVGLFRLQRWARYCVLIIGSVDALVTLLTGAGMVIFAFSPFLNRPSPTGVPPVSMKLLLLSMGGFMLLLAGIGVWWLIYFNLRRIRLLFNPGSVQTQDDAIPGASTAPPLSASRHSVVEVLLGCLAVLYVVTAGFAILNLFVRWPIFFLGLTFRDSSAAVVSVIFGCFSAFLGIGLLRRVRAAWFATVSYQVFGILMLLLYFLPGYRLRMHSYQDEITRRMAGWLGSSTPYQPQAMQNVMQYFSVIVGVATLAAVIWLLMRARPLFGVQTTIEG